MFTKIFMRHQDSESPVGVAALHIVGHAVPQNPDKLLPIVRNITGSICSAAAVDRLVAEFGSGTSSKRMQVCNRERENTLAVSCCCWSL